MFSCDDHYQVTNANDCRILVKLTKANSNFSTGSWTLTHYTRQKHLWLYRQVQAGGGWLKHERGNHNIMHLRHTTVFLCRKRISSCTVMITITTPFNYYCHVCTLERDTCRIGTCVVHSLIRFQITVVAVRDTGSKKTTCIPGNCMSFWCCRRDLAVSAPKVTSWVNLSAPSEWSQ